MQSINIQLDESVTKEVVNLLKSKIEECDQEITRLKNKRNTYLEAINQIEPSTKPAKNQLSLAVQYSSDFTWREKVAFILNSFSRISFSTEILEELFKLEPQRTSMEREFTRKPVSGSISDMVRVGILDRIKVDSYYAYGFKEWFDESGNVKSEYKR